MAFPGDFATVLQDASCTWAWIPLFKFGKVVAYAKTDKADLPLIGNHRWGILPGKRGSYAYRCERIPGTASGSVAIYMHRLIVGLLPGGGRGIHADHVNHDGLDNRRSNLRIVTRAENLLTRRIFTSNKSGVQGVCFIAGRPGSAGSWSADLVRNGKCIHRSRHTTKEAAIAARLAAEREFAAQSQGVSA